MDGIKNEMIKGTVHIRQFGEKVRGARLKCFGHVQIQNAQTYDEVHGW